MKCIACHKDATKRWSPDLDIAGIGFCDEHRHQVVEDICIANIMENGWLWFSKKYGLEESAKTNKRAKKLSAKAKKHAPKPRKK